MIPYMDISLDHIPHPLHRVTLSYPGVLTAEDAQAIADALDDISVSVFLHNREANLDAGENGDGDDWTVTLTTYGAPDAQHIHDLLEGRVPLSGIHIEKLPEKDWLRHVHENFPPLSVGRFYIYGSHVEGDKPQGLIPLQIDAATAFGSGEHETTKGCLLAFEWLAAHGHVFNNALDMGCGSGILAIAMQKIWPDIKLLAVDIDAESIIVTRRHAEMNNAVLEAIADDGYNAPQVPQRAPYDLIAANILAGPLIAMAPDLDRSLAPGGFCVLSGLLARQEQDVTAAHTALGLKLVHKIEINDWRALVLQK